MIPASPAPALLRCVDLEVGHARKALLGAINVEIRAGELWLVIGRNGTGKTTWFRTLLGLQPPVRGSVEPAVADLPIAYVAQRVRFDELFPLRAVDVVRMGADRRWSFLRPRWSGSSTIESAIDACGIHELRDRPFRALSEGQKQRVLIARALVSEPRLILLDEPTAAMDAVAEQQTFQLLDRVRKERNIAIVLVTHHFAAARSFADRALFLDRETNSIAIGSPDEVCAHDIFKRHYDTDDLPGRMSGHNHSGHHHG